MVIAEQGRDRVKAAWGFAQQVEDELWRVRLENPHGHLMVNSYAWRGESGLILVDPGWPWTLDAMEAALTELGLMRGGWEDVEAVLYTHTHIDHMGSAVLIQRRAPQARHICSSFVTDEALAAWHSFQDAENDWTWWVEETFAEPHRATLLRFIEREQAAGRQVNMRGWFGEGALEGATRVSPGEVLEVGGVRLEVIDARGHDPAHVAFWAPERGWLFAGDALLGVPTPISRAMGDDLSRYEPTLSRLVALNPALVLPGHGSPSRGAERVAQVMAKARGYVDQYRGQIRRALDGLAQPVDVYELALMLTDDHQPLTPQSRWVVHLALIDAHLHELARRGEVREVEGPRFIKA